MISEEHLEWSSLFCFGYSVSRYLMNNSENLFASLFFCISIIMLCDKGAKVRSTRYVMNVA